MELKLNYYNQYQQLSSQQVFSDACASMWNLPLVENAKINSETSIYLHDISEWKVPGNTLIIDTERPPHTTNRTTRTLIHNFLRSQPCRDIFIRMMTDHLDITTSRPIVFGTFRIVPLSGTTRNCSNWVFVQHLKDVYASAEDENNSILTFDNRGYNLHIEVPFSENKICNKLSNAQRISELTYALMQGFADIFGMTVLKPKDEVFQNIDNRVKKVDIPHTSIDEMLADLAAHLFTIASEIVLDDTVLSPITAKELLTNPSYELWRI
jgi:hypothetical protein